MSRACVTSEETGKYVDGLRECEREQRQKERVRVIQEQREKDKVGQ